MTSYNAVPTVITGDLWTAAQHNTYIRDNFAATRQVDVFVPTVGGWNNTDATDLEYNSVARGYTMPDLKRCNVNGNWYVPQGFSDTMTVRAVFIPYASGDIFGDLEVYHAEDGEDFTTNYESDSSVTITCNGATYVTVSDALSIPDVTQGELMVIKFQRTATHANDTIGDIVHCQGFIVTYNEYANF